MTDARQPSTSLPVLRSTCAIQRGAGVAVGLGMGSGVEITAEAGCDGVVWLGDGAVGKRSWPAIK